MPVTPLHLAPGTVIKAAVGRHFSFVLFGLSQITMDIEVLVRMALRSDAWHGWSNTLGGATLVLIPTVLIGRPAGQALLRWWNRNADPAYADLLVVDAVISRRAAWTGGILGVYSHWFLDAMMHVDALALRPIASTNPFAAWLSASQVNMLCLVLLIVGCAVLAATRWLAYRSRN